jgi:hypothetical protein
LRCRRDPVLDSTPLASSRRFFHGATPRFERCLNALVTAIERYNLLHTIGALGQTLNQDPERRVKDNGWSSPSLLLAVHDARAGFRSVADPREVKLELGFTQHRVVRLKAFANPPTDRAWDPVPYPLLHTVLVQ